MALQTCGSRKFATPSGAPSRIWPESWARLAADVLLGREHRLFGQFRVGQQALAGLGRGIALRRLGEERRAQLLLQPRDAAARGGGVELEALAGPGQALLTRDGEENLQIIPVQRPLPFAFLQSAFASFPLPARNMQA
jgi:hypothetical protein